jgi:hypothetical protein
MTSTSDLPVPTPATVPPAPGDEVAEGTPGTGEDTCPACGGTGRAGGGTCPQCGGRGTVIVNIGDA